MSAQNLGVFELLDRLSGSFVDATLFRPIADRHVADFARLWKPCFAKAGVARSRRADDASWTWDQQVAERQGQLEWTSFAIEANGATQGLMFAKLGGFARERSQAGRPLVRIDRSGGQPRVILIDEVTGVTVGSLAGVPNLAILIRCLEDGVPYRAIVDRVDGGRAKLVENPDVFAK